jgi:hypothetical protein
VADHACTGCGAHHPTIDDVPCLLHDAADVRGRFAARFAEMRDESDAQLAAIADATARDCPSAATRARLNAFTEGVRATAATIADLGARAGLLAASPATSASAIPSIAGHAALFDHYEYAFRDWGWTDAGAQENELALARVAGALQDVGAAPRVLVLGAGASRLAYDLHHRLAASSTLALDIQPLLVLLARRMFAGDTLVLAEFAANHLAMAHAVTLRRLHAPAPARAGLELAFADATRPPVRPGSFDVVVTPWFLDQLACDVRDVLPAIHGALADGGQWVFYGPLLHPRGKPLARCVTAPELLEQVDAAGFATAEVHHEAMPYLRAPAGSARTEPVLAFAARKRSGEHWSLPPWLRGLALPVPRTAVPHRITDPVASAIATLVDGERSVLAIAALLAHRGVDRRVTLDATIAGLHTLVRATLQ